MERGDGDRCDDRFDSCVAYSSRRCSVGLVIRVQAGGGLRGTDCGGANDVRLCAAAQMDRPGALSYFLNCMQLPMWRLRTSRRGAALSCGSTPRGSAQACDESGKVSTASIS